MRMIGGGCWCGGGRSYCRTAHSHPQQLHAFTRHVTRHVLSYTSASATGILEMTAHNEERDIWKHFLAQGQ